MRTFRRSIPSLLLLAMVAVFAAPVASAASTSCTSYLTPCPVEDLGIIIGGFPGQPSTVTTNSAGVYGGEENIIGSGNSIFDLNTATDVNASGVEYALGYTQIFGSNNTLASKKAYNTISGYNNSAAGDLGNLTINGSDNSVTSDDGNITLIGAGNIVTGSQGQNWGIRVMGSSNTIDTSSVSISGTGNTVTNALESSITGDRNVLSGDFNSVTGVGNSLTGSNSAIVGSNSSSAGLDGAMILGSNSHLGPDATNSIILGSNTSTDTANQAAFGGRTLGQIANGVNSDDGVALNQLNTAMLGFGAGASFMGGVYTPPTFVLTAPGAAGTYTDTNGALLALDNGLNYVNTRIDNLPPPGTGGTGPQGPAGPQGPKGDPGKDGKDGTGNGTDALAVHYDNADKSKVTLSGQNGTQISNVADGVANSDAANVGQVSQQVQDAINTANRYTDASSAQTLNWANSYTDRKFAEVNKRFSTTQAMATAQTQMVATFAGADPSAHNRIAAGVGYAGGHNGLAVGYQHVTRRGVAWNIGGAVAGRDRTIGAGVGYSW